MTDMTAPDPIEAAIAAVNEQLGHIRAADIDEVIRAAAPILKAAGREIGYVDGMHDGREAAAKAIESDPGIPIYFNRKNGETEEQQHDDPVLIRSHAAQLARGGTT